MHETVAGLARAIAFFGYKPSLIQTDNGSEFSDRALTKDGKKAANREGPNAFDRFCEAEGIAHKFIKPRTPEHNGKVERSHRIDHENSAGRYCFTPSPILSNRGQDGCRGTTECR